MGITIELDDYQLQQIADAVAAKMQKTPAYQAARFVSLTELILATGKSREWFVGRAEPYREGALNHYRKELEGVAVQYPTTEHGRYYINLPRMIDWVLEHGLEAF